MTGWLLAGTTGWLFVPDTQLLATPSQFHTNVMCVCLMSSARSHCLVLGGLLLSHQPQTPRICICLVSHYSLFHNNICSHIPFHLALVCTSLLLTVLICTVLCYVLFTSHNLCPFGHRVRFYHLCVRLNIVGYYDHIYICLQTLQFNITSVVNQQ